MKPKNYRELLTDVLNEEEMKLLPRSFDIIGDIAIVEVNPKLKDKARLIGSAIINFHKNVRSVYMKASPIEGTYRVRRLVHIAGEFKRKTIHVEYGLRFLVNIERVYFSPRLSWEHRRVALQVKDGETVIDMFAGVGPFAIHIASLRKAIVYAIDINPYAYKCMKTNIRLNLKLLKGIVIPINADARYVANYMSNLADRVIMNLPQKAHEFVPYALRFLKHKGGVLHFYTFKSNASSMEDLISKFKDIVLSNNREVIKILCVRKVREVAPRRWQVVIDALIR